MSIVEIPEEAVARFSAEAARRGISVDELLALLALELPEPEEAAESTSTPGFVALGTSTSGRRARDADEMLAETFGRS